MSATASACDASFAKAKNSCPPQDTNVDGLPGGEGVVLACSCWLAEVLAMQGAHDQARALFERLLDLRNDVSLLSEGYDPLASPPTR